MVPTAWSYGTEEGAQAMQYSNFCIQPCYVPPSEAPAALNGANRVSLGLWPQALGLATGCSLRTHQRFCSGSACQAATNGHLPTARDCCAPLNNVVPFDDNRNMV